MERTCQANAALAEIQHSGVSLLITINIPGAEIIVDGWHAGVSPLRVPLELGPGTHLVEARLEGYEQAFRRITLVAGSAEEFRIELVPDDSPTVALRPIDRATVRIISVLGIQNTATTVGIPYSMVPDIGHGSGVVVDQAGHVITAAHVVEGADLVIVALPGQREGRPARVVGRHETRDIALLRLVGGPPNHVPIPAEAPSLTASDRISVSGYPLEIGEQYPAASSGEVARARSDGTIQLSMSVNPGNSGGPVINEEGQLIAIVTRRGNPTQGVVNLAVAEPISAARELLAAAAGSPSLEEVASQGEEEAARVLTSILTRNHQQIQQVELDVARWERFLVEAERPAVLALLAFLAFDVLGGHLAVAGVTHESALPEPERREAAHLRSLAANLAIRARADGDVARRYAALTRFGEGALSFTTCGEFRSPCCGDNDRATCLQGLSCIDGVCESTPRCTNDDECPDGQVCPRFNMRSCVSGRRIAVASWTLSIGLALDNHERAKIVEGGQGATGVLFDFLSHGRLPPFRGNLVVGATAILGAWRWSFVVAVLLEVGYRITLGSPRVSATMGLLYNLGFVHAEARNAFSFLGYRALVGLNVKRFGLGLSYRENIRGADMPLRGLEFYVQWRI